MLEYLLLLNIQELKIGWLGVICVCKHISRFFSGLLCGKKGGVDIVRAANSQLARSAELPSHGVSGYLKSCATVCLRQLYARQGREGNRGGGGL